jgi:hypothetical protein
MRSWKPEICALAKYPKLPPLDVLSTVFTIGVRSGSP